MDKLEEVKSWFQSLYALVDDDMRIDVKQVELAVLKEIETLRLDNTYLQQRLQREVEK